MARPILIGLGANLASRRYGAPTKTIAAALAALAKHGVASIARSRWYQSEPVPASGQPRFVNAVAAIETARGPHALLALMQAIERRFGRVRGVRNAPRRLDLDLLDYRGCQMRSPRLILPHPELHHRRFVLEPIAEIDPGWSHPRLGLSARELLALLGEAQPLRPLIG